MRMMLMMMTAVIQVLVPSLLLRIRRLNPSQRNKRLKQLNQQNEESEKKKEMRFVFQM
jgi:uncharacterized membrane protein affecting hemolysin expression